MFLVWNPNRGVFLPVWQRPRWCAPGGAGWRCRRVLFAEDVQPRNVGAVPSIGVGGCPDILDNQGAQCVEGEVVGLGFVRRRSCAEGLLPSAKCAGMQVCDARAAEPVQLLGAAGAEVMPKERGVAVVNYFHGPCGCGASPPGILRRGTGRGTIGLLYGSVRTFLQCGVVVDAVAVSRGLPCVSLCG